MKHVSVIQHTQSEWLGQIEDHLEGRGVRFGYSRPFTTGGSIPQASVVGDGLILLGGGMFLIAKATREIHERLEGETGHASAAVPPSFGAVIAQILVLDIVFSLDSVITAVGMVDEIGVMIAAVVIAVIVMLFSAAKISEFVNQHPTVKMLALSFLLLIGLMLVVEGLHQHIPKGYIYFAIAFSVFVEFLNLRAKGKKPVAQPPVQLHEPYATATGAPPKL